jgi:hypothetical protein
MSSDQKPIERPREQPSNDHVAPRRARRLPRLLAACVAVALAAVAAPPAAAQELPPPALVLGGGRFAVTAVFQAPGAPPSPAFPVALTRDSGTFWFFDAANVELVVKVLEACPVNDHVWVFAAGLTNVGVELTVEDRLAGATWSRSHAGGPAFPPIQDTAAFATCTLAPACGLGTAAEIAATPREDEEAELIALFLGGGLTAPQPLYERVRDDLAALRAAAPELADVPFIPRHDARTLLLTVDEATAAAMEAGTYTAWSCLNDWYAASRTQIFSFPVALVEFAGILDTERIAAEYALLPGVEAVEVNVVARALPSTDYLCALVQGNEIHYFAETGDDGERSFLHFISEPGQAPQPAGSWNPALPEAEPSWFPLFEQCVELYVADCCALS